MHNARCRERMTVGYEYNASGAKARANFPTIGLERHYLGGVFERDERSWGDPDDPWGSTPGSETVQRLFLGGNAYNAPMVLAKVNDGPWTTYNIGRDTQGSITHVMTSDGELKERYVYDPWGNAVQLDSFGAAVDTLAIDYPWSGSGIYSKIVGSHGYTGHEHIVGCGLINANARIYDPFLGRFLSPDPLIQDPASTQNFNRYAYCLNNPLKYTDEDGEFVVSALLVSIGIGAITNVIFNAGNIDSIGEFALALSTGALSGVATFATGGASLGIQIAASTGIGVVNSMSNNAIKQLGRSENGSFDSKQFWRSALSGALTGALTSSANAVINSGGISTLMDKFGLENRLARNVLGNAIEGAGTGIVAGFTNGISAQFNEKGIHKKWEWKNVWKSVALGASVGAGIGAINGSITEHIYQKQLDKGYSPSRSSDMAGASGEFAGASISYLEANSAPKVIGPFGHDYGNSAIYIKGSICIGLTTGRCTIDIDPYAPMVPSQPTYYVPL